MAVGGSASHVAGPLPKAKAEREGPRLSFRVKVAIVWFVIFAFLGVLFSMAKFDWTWMRDNFWFIFAGIKVTVFISVVSIVCATILALLGALGRLSHNSISYGVTGFYISFFRGTPLIVQIFLIYLGLAQVGSNRVGGWFGANVQQPYGKYMVLSPVLAGIVALSLNYGAYMTEIFRAGIQAVGGGQTEAAEALGMTYPQRMRRVVLPQALRIIIPPTGNEFIAMIKDSALCSFIAAAVAWYDIFKRATVAGQADFHSLEALIVAAGLYWGLTSIFTIFQRKLERNMSKGYVRGETTKFEGPVH